MLHFDGFVDCCDALLGTRPVERRLEILRDSRVGAYGVGGGALLLLARYATLESLSPGLWAFAVITAIITGRWTMVWLVTLFPYVRAHGAGSGFRASGARLIGASGMALAPLAALVAFAPWGMLPQRALVLAMLWRVRPHSSAAVGAVGQSQARWRVDRRHVWSGQRAGRGGDPRAGSGRRATRLIYQLRTGALACG